MSSNPFYGKFDSRLSGGDGEMTVYFVTDKDAGCFKKLAIPSAPEEAEWVLKANVMDSMFYKHKYNHCLSSIHGNVVFAVLFPDGRIFDASLGDFRPKDNHKQAYLEMLQTGEYANLKIPFSNT